MSQLRFNQTELETLATTPPVLDVAGGRRWNKGPLNEWDLCALRERADWEHIVACGGLQALCCPRGRKPYKVAPWIAMPADGVRFKPIGVLALPAPPFTATNLLVMTQTVPAGYDGVITDVVCELTAAAPTGFVEGSGDVTWRLGVGSALTVTSDRWLRDMGNVITTLGSLTNPTPVPRGGLRVFSRDVINFFVSLAVGADARLNLASNVICSVSGWYWPR